MSAYITKDSWGFCKVCGEWKDLRYGVCFHCADHVKTDGNWVWDERDPDRKWPCHTNDGKGIN